MAIQKAWQTERERVSSATAARVLAAMLLALASGCANRHKAAEGPKIPPADIRVYESTELIHSRYSLVQHVWVDSWRSNWSFPSFGSEADGIDAMKHAASDAGANALLHVLCIDARRKTTDSQQLYCYADAVRVD